MDFTVEGYIKDEHILKVPDTSKGYHQEALGPK